MYRDVTERNEPRREFGGAAYLGEGQMAWIYDFHSGGISYAFKNENLPVGVSDAIPRSFVPS